MYNIVAVSGVGSDIKWCGRYKGGKRCLLCRRHEAFEVWSREWNWYYLLSWTKWKKSIWREHVSYHSWTPWVKKNWYYSKSNPQPVPARHSTKGLKNHEIYSLLRKGCKKKRKCKCISIIQRGDWYCPNCFDKMLKLAEHTKKNLSELAKLDRAALKKDILILSLSNSF